MTIISTILNVAAGTTSTLLSTLSFVVPFTILPLILTIDVLTFVFGPICNEAARVFHRANSYWGWNGSWLRGSIGPSASGHRLAPVANLFAKQAVAILQDPCPMAQLPPEIQLQILVILLHSTSTHGTYDCTPLLLSKWHRDVLRPHIYASISIATHRQFRALREMLAIHNPSLGAGIQRLLLASTNFDQTGYVADPIAAHTTLSIGIEQLLLYTPNLRCLGLDIYGEAALWDGHENGRLESGPKPIKLQTELTSPEYLNLPIHQELEELDLMCFGLAADVARDLRSTLPRLKRLTLRLVRRRSAATAASRGQERPLRNGVHALASTSPPPLGQWGWSLPLAAQTFDSDSDSDNLESSAASWSDSPLGQSDADEFCSAIDVLRAWPFEKRIDRRDPEQTMQRCGDPLEAITIFAWPSAIRELRRRLQRQDDALERKPSTCRTPAELTAATELHRADMAATLYSDGAGVSQANTRPIPAPPVRLAVDQFREYGPRRGCVMAWASGVD